MIGVGIFVYPALISNLLPHPLWFLFFWFLGGIVALSGALSSALLGAVYPEIGGDYAYLKNIYGKRLAFLYGFITFFITFPGSIALGLVLSVHYQGATLLGDWVNTVAITIPFVGIQFHYYQLIAALLLLVLTVINHLGIESSLLLQKIVTFFPVLFLVSISIFALGVIYLNISEGNLTHFKLMENLNMEFKMPDFFSSGTAMVAVYWTYSGWNSPLALSEEIKHPENVIPRTMIIGPMLVMVLYLLFCLVFLSVLPYQNLQNSADDPFYALGSAFLKNFLFVKSEFSSILSITLSGLIFLIILGNMNSAILTGSRIQVALARDGLFIHKIGELHPKTNTPVLGIWLQSLWALLMILFINKESNLLNFAFICIVCLSVLTIFGVFIIRKKLHHAKLLKMFAFPHAPIFYITADLFILSMTVGNYLRQGKYSIPLYSLLVIFSGLILFQIWQKTGVREGR